MKKKQKKTLKKWILLSYAKNFVVANATPLHITKMLQRCHLPSKSFTIENRHHRRRLCLCLCLQSSKQWNIFAVASFPINYSRVVELWCALFEILNFVWTPPIRLHAAATSSRVSATHQQHHQWHIQQQRLLHQQKTFELVKIRSENLWFYQFQIFSVSAGIHSLALCKFLLDCQLIIKFLQLVA